MIEKRQLVPFQVIDVGEASEPLGSSLALPPQLLRFSPVPMLGNELLFSP